MKTKGSKNKKGVKPITTKHGYIQIYKPEHPMAQRNGYVMEHRMIAYDNGMIVRNSDREIHHLNGIKTDNRIENFETLSKEEHAGLSKGKKKNRKNSRPCKFCPTLTSSKYGMCQKHYKLEWQRGNIYENPELLKN